MASTASSNKSPEFASELALLFPGTDVPLGDGKAVIRVYPAGIIHLKKFSRAIAGAVTQLIKFPYPRKVNVADPDGPAVIDWDAAVPVIVPVLVDLVMTDLFELMCDCCTPNPSLSRVPHWYMGPIITAWFMENFGEEERVRPWVQAMETMIEKLIHERVDLWSMFSTALSPAVMKSMTSSIGSKLGSPMPAGPSRSSTGGQRPPQEATTSDEPTT